jgi:hypothetical protein
MSTAGAEGPEGRDPSGIGFYFNADDSWHSASEAPPRVWDPAWSAPAPGDWPADPPVRRRRSGLAVALGLVLIAGAAVALAWSLTPALRLSTPVRQTEPPSAAQVPSLPVEPPASPAPTVAKAAPAPAATRLSPHHRQQARTSHSRHAAARHGARLRPTRSHGSKFPPAGVRRSGRHAHPAAHRPRHSHASIRIRHAPKAPSAG